MTLLANAFTDPFVDAWEVIKDVLFSTQGFLLIGLIIFIYGMSLLAQGKRKKKCAEVWYVTVKIIDS
jgi:hypothetical protein